MRHLVWILFIGAALGTAQSAQTQPPLERKGDVNFEKEIEKLRKQIQELEASLRRNKPDEAKADGDGKKPFDKKMIEGKGPMPPFGMRKPDDKGPKGPGEKKLGGKGPWGGPPWAKKGEGKGPPPWARKDGRGPRFGGPPWERSNRSPEASRSLERRLDRIIDELEDLRREIRKR